MEFKVPFSGRSHSYTSEEKSIVLDVMENAYPLTQGNHLKEFEHKFCQYSGSEYAFAVCNATAALELAAQLCQFEEGDEIVAPSHTFTASVYPFIKHGAKVRWADIDENTHVVTAETLGKCITSKTKALLVVHLYGFVADMSEIMALAKKHNLLVIEDAAQSIGAKFKGLHSGTFGDFGIYSFHSHKNMTTLGEGGMLTVKNNQFAGILPMLRHNGHCGFEFQRERYWVPAMGNVDLPELNGKILLPNNYCLGEIECALGAKLLERIDVINIEKRTRALGFIDALREFPQLVFHREDSDRHNYHLLVAQIADGRRDDFIDMMAKEKGVQCIVQYYPLHRYDFYKKLGLGNADCPNTDMFFDNMVSFPFHHWIDDEDLEYILKSIKDVLPKI